MAKPRAKVSKQSVRYRPSTGARKCGNCGMYRAGVCDLVAGRVEPGDVCDRWVRRG